MEKTNYRFAGFALLAAVFMFLYLNSQTMMRADGLMRQNGWMSFNEWGWMITTGAIGIFVLITFLLFRKSLIKNKSK